MNITLTSLRGAVLAAVLALAACWVPHMALGVPAGQVMPNELGASVEARVPSGGGVAPPPAQEPGPGTITQDDLHITTTDGETSATVPESAVRVQLGAGQTAIRVDLSTIDIPVNVTLPGAAVDALTGKGATLTIDTQQADVVLPPGSLPSGWDVTVRVEPALALPSLPPGLELVGQAVNIEVLTGEHAAALNKRVTLILAYDTSRAGDPAALFVYRINEDGTLTCLGGDIENGNAVVDLAHLSKYAVMQYRTALADIAGHWAKRDILFMNARGIVKGVSATSFAPERPVTRAEFAALMLRVLGITAYRPSEPTFGDVTPDRWYYGEVEAAYRAGLVKGVGADRFEPDRTNTREEMAVLVLRALKYAGTGLTPDTGDTT